MILVDMNQIMISNLMVQIKDNEINEGLVRHMILKNLRSYEKEFSVKYGELVLAYDSKHYWRRDIFPFYKQNRKKDREKSGYDWNAIFEVLNKIRDEIKEFFPYKVVEVYGAEADDVISTLTSYQAYKNEILDTPKKVLILSGDKDFIQLQKFSFVSQYSPVQKKYIKEKSPEKYVKEHILRGDKSDGIPNFLSDDRTFVNGTRQKPINKKNLEKWIELNPTEFCADQQQLRNYHRNQRLIDFNCVPKEVEDSIIECYESIDVSTKQVPLSYFQEHQLKELMEDFFFKTTTLKFGSLQ